MDFSEINEFGQWTGTCDECGTSHDGNHPDTLSGKLTCLELRAKAVGAHHVVAKIDQTRAKVHGHLDRFVRDEFGI